MIGFADKTWVLLASGPSLTAADVDLCCGRAKVMAINDSWRMAPWADALYAADPEWWKYHGGVPDFAGQKWTQSKEAADKWGLFWIPGKRLDGLSLDPRLIHYGSNSGYQALNLAIHFGARRIILLGYDMQQTGGKSHWHGDHPGPLNRVADYSHFIKKFQTAVPDLDRAGIRVVNCSRETALDCFERRKLKDVIGDDGQHCTNG